MWSILFIVSLGQGIFFLALLIVGKKYKGYAVKYICFLLILFLITNFDYYLVASGLYKTVPFLFGISNGLMLLMGPALYLYTKELLTGEEIGNKQFLHFIPYLIFIIFSLPLFFLPAPNKIAFIEHFISGKLELRNIDFIIFSIQVLHVALYLYRTFKFIAAHQAATVKSFQWVRALSSFLAGYGVIVFILVVVVFATRHFSLTANYIYSLACSFQLYFITGFALLNPTNAFEMKKKLKKPLGKLDATAYWKKVLTLMENDKIFVKPEIKLQDVANMAGLSTHQLSQLINEQAGKSFSDFINHYRIEEFKARVKNADSAQLTLVGLAMEIGFNSKTSFNNTFKKFTGLTPSEYKRSIL